MRGTLQKKLPTKTLLQHTLQLQARAQDLNKKKYCVTTEDGKLLRRNLRACVPAGNCKFVSLVQACQIGSANDKIFFPQAQIPAI